jgi:hypothetical protein
MKKYFLKSNVSEEDLIERSFKILKTPAGKAAVRTIDDEDNAVIIILEPPIREIKHRYPTSKKQIDEKIEDILDLVEVVNV